MQWFDKLKKQKLLSTTLLIFTLSAGVVIGTLASGTASAAKGQAAAPDATPLTIPASTTTPNEFAKLAKMVEPSVVNITTDYIPKQQTTARRRGAPQLDEDGEEGDGMELFRRFFRGGPNGSGMDVPSPQQRPRGQATGSGFVVDKNGYIITNLHVVENADNIKVKFPADNVEYKARVIGTDWESDVAVIKVDAKHSLQAVKIGNSDGVQVGDWAVAIGSPFGLAATVTAGIVSATGRDLATAEQFQKFIQTDAAINPGNSGGPLLNIQGEVIGINTAIATQSGGYQGIGFALPVNTMVRVYNSIIEHGRVQRGSIGVSWQKNSKPEMLEAAGVTHGVLVDTVKPGGPADKVGIKPEDVILSMNGKSVKDGEDLVSRVSDLAVGANTTLTVDRRGKKMDFNVRIEDREDVFKDDARFIRHRKDSEMPEKAEGTPAKFGMSIRPLTSGEKQAVDAGDNRGVFVTRVEQGSFAEDIGMQDRDVIVSVNRQPVTSPDDLRNVQSKLKPGAAVAFRVYRALPQGANNNSDGKAQYQSLYLVGTLPANQ